MYSDKWKEIWKKGKEKRFNLGAKRKIVEDEYKDQDEGIEIRLGYLVSYPKYSLFFFL